MSDFSPGFQTSVFKFNISFDEMLMGIFAAPFNDMYNTYMCLIP